MISQAVGAKSPGGRAAANVAADVTIVQKLLNLNLAAPNALAKYHADTKPRPLGTHALHLDLYGPDANHHPASIAQQKQMFLSRPKIPQVQVTRLPENGKCDDQVIEAIKRFQKPFMNEPDGRVDPRGTTLQKLWPVEYANPTGKKIRGSDDFGSGAYGASRTHGSHQGADYEVTAGDDVLAPLSGKVTRIAKPYSGGVDASVLSGVEIEASDGTKAKIWYMEPVSNIVGSIVRAGETKIGTAKTLQNRYSGITDHVHLEIRKRNGQLVDPSTVITTP